jgi:hypothetical protein
MSDAASVAVQKLSRARRVSLTLPEETFNEIERVAAESGRSVAAVAAQALANGLLVAREAKAGKQIFVEGERSRRQMLPA